MATTCHINSSFSSSNTNKSMSNISSYHAITAGSISGCLSIIACHPLDVIRTKLQTSDINKVIITNANNKISIDVSLIQELKDLLFHFHSSDKFGLGGLYRGFFPPFCAQAIYKAIIFGSNNICNKYIFHNEKTYKTILYSGIFAGTINSLIVAPVEFIRTTQIANQSNIISAIRHINYTTVGLGYRSLWINILPTILRDGPGVGLYFLTFEYMKDVFTSLLRYHDNTITYLPLQYRVLAGSISGIAFWIWAYPLDTIKAVMETKYAKSNIRLRIGLLPTLFDITTGTGSTSIGNKQSINIFKLYRALPTAIARGIPSAAITLTSYDTIIHSIYKNQQQF